MEKKMETTIMGFGLRVWGFGFRWHNLTTSLAVHTALQDNGIYHLRKVGFQSC